jgi:ABC-type dipeptide/oligopeptide/nickel transport system permease subunit
MSNEKDSSFTFVDENHESKTIALSPKDFALVHENQTLYDAKLKSKPTTFFKDAMKRFAKNKSSVVGAVILGILLLLAFILPAVLPSDIVASHPYEGFLAPKLFEAGTGWWDGTKKYNHIAMAVDWEKYESTGVIDGLPSGAAEKDIVGGKNGVSHGQVGDEYTDAINDYAYGGYIRLNYSYPKASSADLYSGMGVAFDFSQTANKDYTITVTTTDAASVKGWSYGEQASYSFYFAWTDFIDSTLVHELPLEENISKYGTFTYRLTQDYMTQLRTLANVASYGEVAMNFTADLKPHFIARLSNDGKEANQNLLVQKVIFTSNDTAEAAALSALSCNDANSALGQDATDSKGNDNPYYWSTDNANGAKLNLYHADIVYCNYALDTYEKAFGNYVESNITLQNIIDWRDRGYLTGDFTNVVNYEQYTTKSELDQMLADFIKTIVITPLGVERCPLQLSATTPLTGAGITGGGIHSISFTGTVTRWKFLYPNRTSCPRYLFGTDDEGKDLLKSVFSGLRSSLLLGVITSAVCFIFGLVWGAISGYFGGWIDIAMERFVEILSGIPWIVVMTLAIILYGQTFFVFAIALCLTGWIGTSSITRTQFYRFKDREYILAARTLGASDFRLIFRHVLPNAVGTIITSSVLMIPSVIFSEATLSYLGLGLKGLTSFGTILSQNQRFIESYPMLIVFPSIIMALIMISFNLFGNGLRDAFNPSLKGEE